MRARFWPPALAALAMAIATGCPEFPLAPLPVRNTLQGLGSRQATGSSAPTVATGSATPGATASASPTPVSSGTPSASPSATPSASPSATPTPTPSPTPSPTPTPTAPPGSLHIVAANNPTGVWTPFGALSRPRMGLVAVAAGNRILVADGNGQEVVDMFAPSTGEVGGADFASQFTGAQLGKEAGHYFSCGAVIGTDKVVMAGGYNGSYIMPTTRVLAAQTATFSFSLSFGDQMKTPRYAAAATAIGVPAAVYVAGGRTSNGAVSGAFEACDQNGQNWIAQTSVPSPVAGAAAVAYQGNFCLIGGYGGSGVPTNQVQVYSPGRGWVLTGGLGAIVGLNTARHSCAATVLGNKVYVLGGIGADGKATDSVEVFDPTAFGWVAGPPMSTPRALLGAVTVGNQIYAIGGVDAQGNVLRTIEVLTP